MENKVESFINIFNQSIENKSFVKLTLSNYKGNELELKNIYLKLIKIKTEDRLSFTLRYKTRDIVKNYSKIESIEILNKYIGSKAFSIANLFSTENDILLNIQKTGRTDLNTTKPTHIQAIEREHDHHKIRPIESNKGYLYELKLTDKLGIVYKNSQDKFKQINHYIELLAPLLREIPKKEKLKVVDMGSGKGYLTFALYDYLNSTLNIDAQVIGVEYRLDLVALCNKIAINSDFKDLQFVQGTIIEYNEINPNILIALHACDTATDDAIYKGIISNADLIVVAPCCHKQIRREMERGKVKNELDFLTQYGIFMERQAEMVTDGIRALILEYFGYKTKVFQFISDAHTPKNVMITASKKSITEKKKTEILEEIKKIKTFFGINEHHLESLLKFE